MLEALSGKSGQGLVALGTPPRPTLPHAGTARTRHTREAGAQSVKGSLAIMIAVMAFGQPV
jgi:hypothetical protein